MKRIIIAGASSGIGFKLAELLASRGLRVGLAARNTEPLKQLHDRYSDSVEYESIDITKASAPGLMRELIERLGGMDIYVHIAGVGHCNPDLEPEAEVDTIRTNAEGFARMIATAYRYFKEKGKEGQIAAVTSIAGTKGIGMLPSYSASKAFDSTYLTALDQLSKIKGDGISFTDIRPGWVATPLLTPGASYPMVMDADFVARRILKAIVRKERVAVIDWRWNIVVGLWRLIPNALWTRMNIPFSDSDTPLPPIREGENLKGDEKTDM